MKKNQTTKQKTSKNLHNPIYTIHFFPLLFISPSLYFHFHLFFVLATFFSFPFPFHFAFTNIYLKLYFLERCVAECRVSSESMRFILQKSLVFFFCMCKQKKQRRVSLLLDEKRKIEKEKKIRIFPLFFCYHYFFLLFILLLIVIWYMRLEMLMKMLMLHFKCQ